MRSGRVIRNEKRFYNSAITDERLGETVAGEHSLAILFLAASATGAQQKAIVLRVGYFPNITHAQALVGRGAAASLRKLSGPGVLIEWKAFNAGPSAIEALFANAIDLTYVGPNPAVAGYVRSQGEAVRVIAGAASGGASLVVRQGSGIQKASDFHGKKVATPMATGQFAGCGAASLVASQRPQAPGRRAATLRSLPITNADQFTLFLKGQLDAAWAPEPWAARLVHEAGGRIFLDERDLWPNREFIITDLIVRPRFLKEHPDVVKNFLRVHVELTDWINKNPAEAKRIHEHGIAKRNRRESRWRPK